MKLGAKKRIEANLIHMTHHLSYFDAIYIINLPYRLDRRKQMETQLKKIGLSFKSPNVRLFPAIRPEDKHEFPSIGARGCFLSHLAVLRDASEKGLQRILICEDDLNFASDFSVRCADVVHVLKSQAWSVLYGGYEMLQLNCDEPGFLYLEPSVSVQTTYMMAIQGPTIASVARYFETMLTRRAGDLRGGPMHVDGAYSWFRRENPDALTLVITPKLGYQRSSKSDIDELNFFNQWLSVRSVMMVKKKIQRSVRLSECKDTEDF